MNDTNSTNQNIKQFSSNLEGILYIVSTPIGNLEDITFRAVNTLQKVDLIVCEDTRHTRKLLSYYSINTPCVNYHDYSDEEDRKILISKLLEGKKLALVSDSGTPLVSDPGYKLVNYSLRNNIKVVPIPGACAAIAALSVSALPSDSFIFVGFLPRAYKACLDKLIELKGQRVTLVFYESPKRLVKTLSMMLQVFGNRKAAVARELTKIHEEVLSSDIETLCNAFSKQAEVRGEIVLLLQGNSGNTYVARDKIIEELKFLLNDLTLKDAVKEIASLYNLPKKEIYSMALSIKQKLS